MVCTTAAGVNSSVRWTTLPSGAMAAEIPDVAATRTQRPCSTARSRLIASCCFVSGVCPKVALFVWIVRTCPPASTVLRTSASSDTSKQMMSPRRAGPTVSAPGVLPGAKSFETRSTAEEKTRARRRIGMYSANGTGCCLAYCAPGPGVALLDGCQTMPALSSVLSSCGFAMTAPTRIGTPTESTACWINAAALSSV